MSNLIPKNDQNQALTIPTGEGFEGVDVTRDLIIPRLTILQALSPQLQKAKAEYIAGAGMGDFCDTGLGDVLPSPLRVIPVHYSVKWLQWGPRNSGKGLVAIHDSAAILDQCKRDASNRPYLPNGDMISESANFFVILPDHDMRRAFISMAATQRKKAKRWLMLAMSEKTQGPDGRETLANIYSRQYVLSTVLESNNEGNWYGWKIERGDKATHEQVAQAILFRQGVSSGHARAATAADADELPF